MRIVAVYFSDPHEDGYPLNKEEYRVSYRDLARMIQKKSGRFVIVRGMKTYRGGMRFSHYWELEGDAFVKHEFPVDADILYDKGEDFKGDASVRFLNNLAFDALCANKEETAKMFPDLVPVTVVVHSADEVESALQKIPSDTVVAKPVDGAEGRGIFIEPKADIAKHIPSFPYLLQEFIDTSHGIPGLTDGVHDFRMICIDDDIVVSYIRVPAEDLLISNISLGGKEVPVPIENIPQEALALQKKVDEKVSLFGKRIYTLDLARHKDGTWKIIELNAKPGLSPISMGKDYVVFYHRLTDLLLDID